MRAQEAQKCTCDAVRSQLKFNNPSPQRKEFSASYSPLFLNNRQRMAFNPLVLSDSFLTGTKGGEGGGKVISPPGSNGLVQREIHQRVTLISEKI